MASHAWKGPLLAKACGKERPYNAMPRVVNNLRGEHVKIKLSVCFVCRVKYLKWYLLRQYLPPCVFTKSRVIDNFCSNLLSVGEQKQNHNKNSKNVSLSECDWFQWEKSLLLHPRWCGILCQVTSSKASTKLSWNDDGKERIPWNGPLEASLMLMDYRKIIDRCILSINCNRAFFVSFAFPRNWVDATRELPIYSAWCGYLIFFLIPCNIFAWLFMWKPPVCLLCFSLLVFLRNI